MSLTHVISRFVFIHKRQKILIQISGYSHLNLIWVRLYTDIVDNCIADELAFFNILQDREVPITTVKLSIVLYFYMKAKS